MWFCKCPPTTVRTTFALRSSQLANSIKRLTAIHHLLSVGHLNDFQVKFMQSKVERLGKLEFKVWRPNIYKSTFKPLLQGDALINFFDNLFQSIKFIKTFPLRIKTRRLDLIMLFSFLNNLRLRRELDFIIILRHVIYMIIIIIIIINKTN